MTRNPTSNHAPAMATPRSTAQSSAAPAHIVRSASLQQRRLAAANRKQV